MIIDELEQAFVIGAEKSEVAMDSSGKLIYGMFVGDAYEASEYVLARAVYYGEQMSIDLC